MPETEMLKFVVQMGMGGVFFWLYYVTNKRLQEQQDQHDHDIDRLYNLRINDLKLFARLPTDLEGTPPESHVKA
jgi:hypothetical protein